MKVGGRHTRQVEHNTRKYKYLFVRISCICVYWIWIWERQCLIFDIFLTYIRHIYYIFASFVLCLFQNIYDYYTTVRRTTYLVNTYKSNAQYFTVYILTGKCNWPYTLISCRYCNLTLNMNNTIHTKQPIYFFFVTLFNLFTIHVFFSSFFSFYLILTWLLLFLIEHFNKCTAHTSHQ